MLRELHLERSNPRISDPLEFAWDDETGEVTGRDAARVKAMADDALRNGTIGCKPIPSCIDATDPLRNRTEFAALLGDLWKLPSDLDAAYPVIEDDGSLEPSDIPILY